jgi:hypothetical protein
MWPNEDALLPFSTQRVLRPPEVEQLITMVEELEALRDLRQLMALWRHRAPRKRDGVLERVRVALLCCSALA